MHSQLKGLLTQCFLFPYFICEVFTVCPSRLYVALGSGKMQSGLSVSDSDGSSFAPLVVLELAENTEEEAITWLLNRIKAKQQNGGNTPATV